MNSGIIPATPYFLSSLFRLSLIGSAIKLEFVGFTVMKTFPNCEDLSLHHQMLKQILLLDKFALR